jgi:hypothetical protein
MLKERHYPMKISLIVICLIILCFLCGFGSALTVYQNESQLIQTTDLIVYGKIVDVKSAWNAQKTHIETSADVMVNETLKNINNTIINQGSTITVSVFGGTIGNTTEWVEDTPVLIQNTDAIFFLKRMSNDTYSVVKLYYVIKGKMSDSTLPSLSTDIVAIKQEIIEIQKGNASGPGTSVTMTPKAESAYFPVIAMISIFIVFYIRRK